MEVSAFCECLLIFFPSIERPTYSEYDELIEREKEQRKRERETRKKLEREIEEERQERKESSNRHAEEKDRLLRQQRHMQRKIDRQKRKQEEYDELSCCMKLVYHCGTACIYAVTCGFCFGCCKLAD